MMKDERRKDTAVQEKRLFILTFLNFFRIETKRRRRPSSSTSPPHLSSGALSRSKNRRKETETTAWYNNRNFFSRRLNHRVPPPLSFRDNVFWSAPTQQNQRLWPLLATLANCNYLIFLKGSLIDVKKSLTWNSIFVFSYLEELIFFSFIKK